MRVTQVLVGCSYEHARLAENGGFGIPDLPISNSLDALIRLRAVIYHESHYGVETQQRFSRPYTRTFSTLAPAALICLTRS